MTEELRNHNGLIGVLSDIEYSSKDSILVLQLPRASHMISKQYAEEIRRNIQKMLPEGRDVLIIPGNVNIFEVAGEDMLYLKLKGLL